MDQGLYQFAQQYQRNINDPETLNAYYGYLMECMDEKERIDTAREEGREEGELEKLIGLIHRKMLKNKTREQIADELELNEAEAEILENFDKYTYLLRQE
ncbi:MAG: hypothetical protein FWG14_09680 [Peptococcaceae bacterium]|nr:hypothetical protein [Peptococcaceae bacterium]